MKSKKRIKILIIIWILIIIYLTILKSLVSPSTEINNYRIDLIDNINDQISSNWVRWDITNRDYIYKNLPKNTTDHTRSKIWYTIINNNYLLYIELLESNNNKKYYNLYENFYYYSSIENIDVIKKYFDNIVIAK